MGLGASSCVSNNVISVLYEILKKNITQRVQPGKG